MWQAEVRRLGKRLSEGRKHCEEIALGSWTKGNPSYILAITCGNLEARNHI
jgi:hypothetical protein